MTDADRELAELRREIVEARNQAIKTDNQVKNLALDIKGFEKRFDALERRTRAASMAAHVLVAVTILVAAYIVHAIRVRDLTGDLDRKIAAAEEAKATADAAAAEGRAKVSAVEAERSRRERSASVALKLVDLLDKQREREAADLLASIDLATLTPLEAKLFEGRANDLRVRAAETAYKNAKTAQTQSRNDTMIAELRRVLAIDPTGKYAGFARYLLATQLWSQKKHAEAEPVFRDILKHENDKAVVEEARYLLATSLAALGRRDDAKTAFTEIQQKGGRYAQNAKEQLAALEAVVAPPGSTAAPAPKKLSDTAAAPATAAPSTTPKP